MKNVELTDTFNIKSEQNANLWNQKWGMGHEFVLELLLVGISFKSP